MKTAMLKFLVALLIVLAAPVHAAAPALPAGVQHITSVEGVDEYRLVNGLKILLFPDAAKPTLSVNVTYLVGSRHENYGETGMAHLLEHLLFKGTPTHKEIPKELKQRGANFNATTSLDRTNYFELLPANEDNLKWALTLEADRMVNSNIAKTDLDSEMTVVRNEFEMGENSPQSVVLKRMQSIAYDWHSYGRSTIGNRSDIENVRIENLQAFYRTYYQPDNAVLIVTGKFEPQVALRTVAERFGKIAAPKRALPPQWTVEPTQDGERSFVVRRKDELQMAWAAYKIPSSLHPDAAALSVAGSILSNSPSGRVHKALVEGGKAAVQFGFPLAGLAPGLYIYGVVVKNGEALEPARDALLQELETAYRTPPSDEEMARAKLAFQKQFEQTLNNPEAIATALSESSALGDWRLFFNARDRLAATSAEEVVRVMQHYLRRDNRTVGLYLPEATPQRAEIPPAPSAAEAMKNFKAKAASAEGEIFDSSPANIDARTHRIRIGDLKVALLPKKNRGETVKVNIGFKWGDEASLFGKKAVSEMTAAMLDRGTEKMTRTQLADKRDKLKMTGGYWAFETRREHLPEALRLAAEVMRNASFPSDEFDQLKKLALAGLDAARSDPGTRATEALSRHFNTYPKGDPRYVPTLEESFADIQALTVEQVRQFHREFYGASTGQIAIVGDFAEAEITPVLQEAFGDWKSQRPYAHVLKQYAPVAAARFAIDTPDKENAFFATHLALDLKDDSSDYAAMAVVNMMLGGNTLSSRLGDRVRQKDGLSYSVGSQLTVNALDNAAGWGVVAIAAPQNVAKVEAAVREELARALKDGFTAQEVTTAISALVQENQRNRAQDGVVAGIWNHYLFLDRTFVSRAAKLEQEIKAVTPVTALAALRKHIKPELLSTAIAGDEKKMGKGAGN